MEGEMNEDIFWQAVSENDRSFDGIFFTCVKSCTVFEFWIFCFYFKLNLKKKYFLFRKNNSKFTIIVF